MQPAHKPRADLEALPRGVKGEIIDDGRGGPGGWWILPEPGVELPNTPELSPDLAGWRRDRLPTLPPDAAIAVVPDWVCEILSPTTRRHNLLIKKPYYARVGFPHHWIVDLEARIDPFGEVALDIATWWG